MASPRKKRKYSSRNHLRNDSDKILGEFVSGARNGQSTDFFCTMCERDVSMISRGLVRSLSDDWLWVRFLDFYEDLWDRKGRLHHVPKTHGVRIFVIFKTYRPRRRGC